MAVPALADLLIYALVFFALAFAFAARKMTQALLGGLIAALQSIPLIGGKLASPLRDVEHAIVGACYSIEDGADRLAGVTWHQTARLLNWTWRELRAHAAALASIAPGVGSALALYHGIRAIVHRLTVTNHGQTARVKALERELHGIEHQVKTLERDFRHGIGEDVLPRLKHLDKELSRVEHKTIPAIRSDVATAENDVTALRKWVVANIPIVGTTAFAGAVAVALSTLGLGGLRCPSFGKFLRKWGCGLGNLLDGLLGLVISALALENVCSLLPILEAAFGDVVGPVIHLLTEVPLGACEQPPKGWAMLTVAAGSLPPPQTLGTLPT